MKNQTITDTFRTVDDLCDEFEKAWQAGERPELAAWLTKAGGLAKAALPELAALDLDYRLRAKESCTAREYLDAGLEPEALRWFYASNLGAGPYDRSAAGTAPCSSSMRDHGAAVSSVSTSTPRSMSTSRR